VATVHLLCRDLAHSAFTLLLLIASFVEKRLVPVTRHIHGPSLSFLRSRAQRWCSEHWFPDSGPVEDSADAMENLASWRSTRLRRPAAVQIDVPKLSPSESEAAKSTPAPAGPVRAPRPKRDPGQKRWRTSRSAQGVIASQVNLKAAFENTGRAALRGFIKSEPGSRQGFWTAIAGSNPTAQA
jgi:hypothetical protein